MRNDSAGGEESSGTDQGLGRRVPQADDAVPRKLGERAENIKLLKLCHAAQLRAIHHGNDRLVDYFGRAVIELRRRLVGEVLDV